MYDCYVIRDAFNLLFTYIGYIIGQGDETGPKKIRQFSIDSSTIWIQVVCNKLFYNLVSTRKNWEKHINADKL